jgi:hypothetical protein
MRAITLALGPKGGNHRAGSADSSTSGIKRYAALRGGMGAGEKSEYAA